MHDIGEIKQSTCAITYRVDTHLAQQKARDRLGIHTGCGGHSFVRLAGQLRDADIRKHGSEGVGDVEVAETFGADLEHHRNSKLAKALAFEVVPAQRAQITERCPSIGNGWRPKIRGSEFLQLLKRDKQCVTEERHREILPLAGLRQLFKPCQDFFANNVRPGGFIEHQLTNTVRDFSCGGKRGLCTVGVAEKKNGFTNRLNQRHHIAALILKRVPFGRVRFTPPATGDRMNGELLLEAWRYKLPVTSVIAEGAVHEHQGRAAAYLSKETVAPVDEEMRCMQTSDRQTWPN